MARPQTTDPLHNFRYHARAGAVAGLGDDPFQPESLDERQSPEAGFQAITTPEYTAETAEYREGLMTFTQKYPGVPTTNTLTFTRGVARKDTAFLLWVLAAIGGAEYRTEVDIFHAGREGRSNPFSATDDFTPSNSKIYTLNEAWPNRVKIAGDMDATSSDISLGEVDIEFESFDVAPPTA